MQTIAFNASRGQVLTAKLFAAAADIVVATASSVGSGTNDASLYTANFSGVSTGTYRLTAFNGGVPAFTDHVSVTAASGEFVTNSFAVVDVSNTAITEAYAGSGETPTLAEILWQIQQALTEFSISGTTISVKNTSGSTVLTYTMDSASAPRSRTKS